MAVQRDINKEKLALKSYQSIYKKNPTTAEDWANLHRIAYPVSAGGLPDELKSSVNESLYNGTGMASVSGATAPLATDINTLRAGVDSAAANVQKTSQPNEALRILQEAIRAKSGQANQSIGENPLFKQLGVTGMGALSQSIASQGKKLDMDFSNFKNIVGQMSGTYKDMATAALNNYEMAYQRYKDEADKITQEEKDLRDHAQALELVNTNFQNSLKLKEYENAHPGVTDAIKASESGFIQDESGNWTKDVPIQMPSNSKIGDGVVTAYGSKLWGAGLDYALSGGKGAPVKSPFIGEVVWTGVNKGFGNQVRIKTASGEEIWLSHLDSIRAKVGDQVNEESVIGTQGNSGDTYGKTGVHVDVTMKKADGSYYSPEEVAKLIGVQNVVNNNVDIKSELVNDISVVTANMPVNTQKVAVGAVTKYLESGDTKKAQDLINQYAVKSMKGTILNDFNSFNLISSNLSKVLADWDKLATDSGPYKQWQESGKPFAGVVKDQKWVKFMQGIEENQAKYRNAIYGASLTDNELKSSNRFMVDPSRDDIQTIKTKLQSMQTYAETAKKAYVDVSIGKPSPMVDDSKLINGEASISSGTSSTGNKFIITKE